MKLLTLIPLVLIPLSAATLTPDSALSFWRNAAEGSTLSFSPLAPVGGVTGFKAFGQAEFGGFGNSVPLPGLVIASCGFPVGGPNCLGGPPFGNTDPANSFSPYDGTRFLFNTVFDIATPGRPNDLIGFTLSFRVDNNGVENIITQALTTQRSFDLSGFYDLPNSPGLLAYNWFLDLSFFGTLVDPVGESGITPYTITIPQNSIDITGQAAPVTGVPEPGTVVLLGAGLATIALLNRRR